MGRPFTLVLIFFLALTACEKDNADPEDGPITTILLSSNTYKEKGIELNWTASNDSILSYQVCRFVGKIVESYTYNFETLAIDVNKNTLNFIDDDIPNAPLVSYVILGEMFDSGDNRGWYIFSNVVEYVREVPLDN